MAGKRPIGTDVLDAAESRLARVFDDFPRVYVSFSAGKDSTVLLHLAARMARERGRRIGCLLVDLEAQYALTIEHAARMFEEYADALDPHWVAMPLSLRNAVSAYEPKWTCWDPAEEERWVRPRHPLSVGDPSRYPFFRAGMEFEEFVPAFGEWYAQGKPCACLVGIRSDESLNRYRTVTAGDAKASYRGLGWTTWVKGPLYNAYPIYDWRTEDVWTYHGKTGLPYNPLYDRMHQAGLTLSQMRICQPYGDDQRKGLWLYHLIEPETWPRVVARVAGANGGALYAQETGNVNGVGKITKPEGMTWRQFAHVLMESMPPKTADHFRDKIAVFVRWWEGRGYPQGIPDEADPKDEAEKSAPSWRRVCKALLRNDHWCKGLSFSQTKSENYERWKKVMKNRRRKWGMYA